MQGLARRRFAQEREALVEPFDLAFGFDEMLFKALAQTVEPCRLRHLRQRLRQLLLGMKNVAELVHQQIVDPLRSSRRRALGLDGCFSAAVGRRKRRRLHELPVPAFIPRSARVDLAFIARAGRVVEELVHKAGRGRDLADGECRLLHALQSGGKRLHVRDFARHQELQGVLGARHRRRN